MTDHKAALEHAKQFADSTQSGEHSNLCRAYLELAQRIKESQEQDPAGSFVQCNGEHWATWRQTKYGHPGSEKLYLHPPIPPTQQEVIDKVVAEYQLDAERYRWLRKNGASICGDEHQVEVSPGNWKWANVFRSMETLDAEIDEAIRKGE